MAGFNDFMSGLGKGIDEIAAEISGSSYYKNIMPGKQGLMNEANNLINNNAKVKARIQREQMDSSIAGNIQDTVSMLNEMGADISMNRDTAESMARVMRGSDYSDEAFDKLSSALQGEGIGKDHADAIAKATKVGTDDIMQRSVDINTASILQKPATYVQAYFSHPDKNIKSQRIATAVGAYAGLTIGGRYLSGGTLTRDSYGQKDIAGVPFL